MRQRRLQLPKMRRVRRSRLRIPPLKRLPGMHISNRLQTSRRQTSNRLQASRHTINSTLSKRTAPRRHPPMGSTGTGTYYATPGYVATKDHVAAGLLAIFLGGLGIHKFYLGYNTAGFIMLAVTVLGSIVSLGLAGAVVWVISIVEGIIYLTKSQTEFDNMYVYNQKEWF